ncbi:hypothetical protein N2152v2_007402, partial [Parachlorella kessleri]
MESTVLRNQGGGPAAELGTPVGVLSLAALPPGVPPATDARLWVPADWLFAAKLPAATVTLVGVVSSQAAGAANLPISLHQLYKQQHGISAVANDAAEPSGLGKFVVAAELWPAQRLAKGSAAATPSLRDALGRPGPGTQLAIYPLPAAEPTTPAEHPGQHWQQGQLQRSCRAVYLRLCTRPGPFATSPALLAPLDDEAFEEAAAAAATPAPGAAAQPPASRGRAGGAFQATTPASPAMRAGGSTPAALSPAMRAGGGTPVALSPAMRGSGSRQPAALGPPMRSGSGAPGAALGSNSKGGQAPGTPQTPTPAVAESPGGRSRLSGSGGEPAAPTGLEARPSSAAPAAGTLLALLQDTGSEHPRLRQLVEALLLRTLCGRRLLAGNLVEAPILGQQAVFLVERIDLAPAAGGMPDPGAGHVAAARDTEPSQFSTAEALHSNGVLPTAPVALDCQVHLLAPGEEAPESDGSEQAAPGRTGASRYADEAAQAAAASVGGGAEGPAALAASRAAAAGFSSGGMEFGLLGGAEGPKQALRELVALPLRAPQLFARYHVAPPRGILLHGPPGSGKTVLARAAAAAAGARLFVINGPDVVSEYFGESEAGLRGVFAAAKALAPSVVFIDELDAIAPSRGGAAGSAAKTSGGGSVGGRLVTTLLLEMDSLGDSKVVLISATNRVDAIDTALRRPGRFDREVEVGVPIPADRRDILSKRLAIMQHSLTEQQVAELADAAHGFVPADLAALCNEAALATLRRVQQQLSAERGTGAALEGLCVTWADFAVAETRVRPSAMREVAVEVPKVRWDDVGGLDEVKQQLKEAVEWPFKNPDSLLRLGAQAPKGNKTLLARAVASQARLNFLAIKGPELYSKYVGESEKAIAKLFSRAREASPSIIFFDELDGLVTSREEGGTNGVGVGERVLSQLLLEMDGLQ